MNNEQSPSCPCSRKGLSSNHGIIKLGSSPLRHRDGPQLFAALNFNQETPCWCSALGPCSLRKTLLTPTCSWLPFQSLAPPKKHGHWVTCHPSLDPDGAPLAKESPFFAKMGQPLAMGWKGVLWALQGDHEYFSHVLKLPHWRNHRPCWECNATNKAGDKPYTCLTNFGLFEGVTNATASAHKSSEHPIFSVSGVTTKMVRGDPPHIRFCKGIYSHLLGSLLQYVCFYDDGVQRKQPSERLGIVFQQIQANYSSQSCRMTNLTMSMFCNPESPWSEWASLNCKGGEGTSPFYKS